MIAATGPITMCAAPKAMAIIATAPISPARVANSRGQSARIAASVPARHSSSRKPATTKLTNVTVSQKYNG